MTAECQEPHLGRVKNLVLLAITNVKIYVRLDASCYLSLLRQAHVRLSEST